MPTFHTALVALFLQKGGIRSNKFSACGSLERGFTDNDEAKCAHVTNTPGGGRGNEVLGLTSLSLRDVSEGSAYNVTYKCQEKSRELRARLIKL